MAIWVHNYNLSSVHGKHVNAINAGLKSGFWIIHDLLVHGPWIGIWIGFNLHVNMAKVEYLMAWQLPPSTNMREGNQQSAGVAEISRQAGGGGIRDTLLLLGTMVQGFTFSPP